MEKRKLTIVSNGGGANFEALVIASRLNLIPFEISLVTTKHDGSSIIMDRARRLNVPYKYIKQGSQQSLSDFHHHIATRIRDKIDPDLVMFLSQVENPTPSFLTFFPNKVLVLENKNLSLTFDCFKYYSNSTFNIKMYVEQGGGEYDLVFFKRIELEYLESDTLKTFTQRYLLRERELIFRSLFKFLQIVNSNQKDLYKSEELEFSRYGKVRDLYEYRISEFQKDPSLMMIIQTGRLSSFDRHITNIKGRGQLLTQITEWWFQNTRKIVPNHFIKAYGNIAIVKPAKVIPLEIVVRSYITGSTKTSLWVNYQKDHTYCGITFPEGLKKNQKLDELVLTPTTKGVTDEPLSETEILERGLLKDSELEYIKTKAFELFRFGQKVADRIGYILVDTKYEFGYDSNGSIMLIDEIHTPDSSRYWKKDTYQERFEQGLEPEKIDKDAIRDYLKENMEDPYSSNLPEIPSEKKSQVLKSYFDFASQLLKTKTEFQDFEKAVDETFERRYFQESDLEQLDCQTILSPEDIQAIYDLHYHCSVTSTCINFMDTIWQSLRNTLIIVFDEAEISKQNILMIEKSFNQKGIPTDSLPLSPFDLALPSKILNLKKNVKQYEVQPLVLVLKSEQNNYYLADYFEKHTQLPVLRSEMNNLEIDRMVILVDRLTRVKS